MKHVPAQYNKSAFHCPTADCGAYAKQTWYDLNWILDTSQGRRSLQVPGLRVATCDHCGKFSVWFDMKLVHPVTRTAPAPHPDLPESIKTDYEEARAV